MEIPLRSASAFSAPRNPKRRESETKESAFFHTVRERDILEENKGKVIVGISMVIPPQQLLLQLSAEEGVDRRHTAA